MEDVISHMAGYVPLKAIAERILAAYARDPFGDFKVVLFCLCSFALFLCIASATFAPARQTSGYKAKSKRRTSCKSGWACHAPSAHLHAHFLMAQLTTSVRCSNTTKASMLLVRLVYVCTGCGGVLTSSPQSQECRICPASWDVLQSSGCGLQLSTLILCCTVYPEPVRVGTFTVE